MMGDHGSAGEMMGSMGSMGMGAAGAIWLLLGVALIVLVVLAVAWIALHLRVEPGGPRGGGPSALDELDRRYARGEIDRETYLGMRRDLGGR